MIHFIVNPQAGRKRAKEIIPIIENVMRYHNEAFQIKMTALAEDIQVFTEQAIDAKATAIIAVGGDGTINDVINVLADNDSDIPFGVLPGGSGNDFLRTFKGKHWKFSKEDVKKDIEKFLSLQTIPIDLLKANDMWVANMAIFGLGGEIADKAEELKVKYGSAAYILSTFYNLLRYKSFPATITKDGGEEEEVNIYLLCLGNGRFYGSGIEICLHAVVNDGKITGVLAEDQSKTTLIRLLLSVLRSKHAGKKEIVEFDCESFTMTPHVSQIFTIDGHVLESDKKLVFSIVKDKINYLA